MSAISSAAASSVAASSGFGFVMPETFRTNWREAASISSRVAGGSRPRSSVMFRHMRARLRPLRWSSCRATRSTCWTSPVSSRSSSVTSSWRRRRARAPCTRPGSRCATTSHAKTCAWSTSTRRRPRPSARARVRPRTGPSGSATTSIGPARGHIRARSTAWRRSRDASASTPSAPTTSSTVSRSSGPRAPGRRPTDVTRAPSGGARADEQRAADRDTLAEKVDWLHAQADAVASTEPMLRTAVSAGEHASGAAAADELRSLGERACAQVVTARTAIEHLATQLELAARVHAHGDAFARDGLFHGSGDPQRLASGPSTTADEVVRLVADVSEDLPGDEGDRARARLPRATESELTLLGDLVEAGLTHDQLVRLLAGGHLLLPGHRMLKRWHKLPGVEPRTSSHYHPDDRRVGRGPEWVEAARARVDDAHAHPVYGQQYGLNGKFVHEVLFGPGPHHTTF